MKTTNAGVSDHPGARVKSQKDNQITTECQTRPPVYIGNTPESPAGAALRTKETFTRDQLVWCMAQAQRLGYEAGYEEGYTAGQRDEMELASIAAAYADHRPFSGNATHNQAKKANLRREMDAAAGLPRPGDYRPRAEPDNVRVAA